MQFGLFTFLKDPLCGLLLLHERLLTWSISNLTIQYFTVPTNLKLDKFCTLHLLLRLICTTKKALHKIRSTQKIREESAFKNFRIT